MRDRRFCPPLLSTAVGVESLDALLESFEDCCLGKGGFSRIRMIDSFSAVCFSLLRMFKLFDSGFLTSSELFWEIPDDVVVGKIIDARFCCRRANKSLEVAVFLLTLLAGSSISVVIVDEAGVINAGRL
jgi:hypothetical protein